ncbi:MAG: hypothetical protein PHR35_20280 [Kiritimatiellae bacterium]|nr:hypothetical protein [Kiritimatiellia bacterium]
MSKREISSIRWVFSCMILSASLVGITGCSTTAHYRRCHDGKSLYKVAYRQLQNGDSYEKVVGLLGPGTPATERQRHVKSVVTRKHPESYPDGVTERDVIIFYPIDRLTSIDFQFRDERLINFDPKNFSEFRKPTYIKAP